MTTSDMQRRRGGWRQYTVRRCPWQRIVVAFLERVPPCDNLMSTSNASRDVSSVRCVSLFVVMLLCVSVAPLLSPEPASLLNRTGQPRWSGDVWNETPFRDVAVPEGFTFLSYTDYSDVGVLINNNSATSRTIGWAFVGARNISPEHVFLFDNESTPTGETINNQQFDDYFADPLRQMILDRNLTNDLNYLVTTKGVPLRVSGSTNARASFDSEIGLINGQYNNSIHVNWWVGHTYGPGSDSVMEQFSREKYGFYLVTRLTGYSVDTALGLIEKANNSFGNRGQVVLDLATNRNGSGYKWWNDMLYYANTTLAGGMGLPVHFNQNSTFVTNETNVMFYASWGSNDGSWGQNWLPNSGFDTSSSSWSSGSKYWDAQDPPLAGGETFSWGRQTSVKQGGNSALEGVLEPAACTASVASATSGLLAEYFDNAGLSYNSSQMPDLTGRTPDYWRSEPNIDHAATSSTWAGLDNRFDDYWSARHTGAITIPDSGNWTFYLDSDDGTKLWLDEVEIVVNQGMHGMREVSATVWLDAGEHSLRTEFFEHGGWAGFIVSWEGPNQTKQVVPSSAFTRGVSAPAAPSGLVHHWTFDESNGTTVADSVGTADLTLFNSNNGSSWQQCLFGNCYSFDGSDDYAKVDVNDWGGDFSVSLWANTQNSSQSLHSSVIAVNDVAGDDDSFQIETSGGSNGDWQVWSNSTYTMGSIDAGSWTHLAVTFQNNTLRMYKGGLLVGTSTVPAGDIDSIELYKMGVNRAGNTHFEGLIDEVQVWNRTLSDDDVAALNAKAAWECPDYSAVGTGETYVEQEYDFPDELRGHAWILYGYARKAGWLHGDYRIEIDGYDTNGSLLSTNVSSTNTLSDSWNSRTIRFRAHANATSFKVRMVALLDDVTRNGSVYFDSMNLRAIRPHFEWVDGSIAETAVSTGGRSFNWDTGYGQSLVADLLEDGVSGVKGYVYEPYLTAVSYPNVLLPYYAYGYNLAEVYYASNPLISWMGTVVGDPKMAAYSDILHDINVSAVRTNGTLSIGVNGSVEVLLENLGPGEANGYLEVRDRVGGTLLANHTVVMPPGDQSGSRVILTLNLTPTRVGFNEYVIRYVAGNWSSPERIVDNNLGILNLQVNEPPVAESLSCSTLIAARGDVVGCTTLVSDDFGVVRARLGWRLNGSGDEWTFIESASSDSVEWYASLSVPTDIPVGTLDLLAEVRDAQGLVDLLEVLNGLQVTDATATWHGIHVAGVDEDDWDGASPLSDPALSGVTRGVEQTLTACVVDADHDATVAIPVFIATRGVVSAGEPVNSTDPLLHCYSAFWMIEWGSPRQSAELHLYDHLGTLWNTRTIPVDDVPWEAKLTLIDPSGVEQQFARGLGEWVRITMSDVDDPLTGYSGRLTATWPGHVPRSLDVEIDESSNGTVEFRLPLADGMLVPGDLELSLTLTDDGLTGMTREFSASWLLHMQPPEVLDIGLCEGGPLELIRGTPQRGWISMDAHRMLEEVSFTVAQSGTIAPMTSSPVDWPDCQFPDTRHYMWGFELLVDNRFSEGEATLLAIATDVDGLRGTNEWTFQIAYGEPRIDIDALPTEVSVGEANVLELQVNDPDGHEGTDCVVLVRDQNASIVLKAQQSPDNDGRLAPIWWPPAEGAPFILTVGCTDAHGNQAAATSGEIGLAAQEVDPTDEEQSAATPDEFYMTAFAAVAAGLLLLLLVASLSSLLLRRRSMEMSDEVIEQDAAWAAPEDSYKEGVQSLELQQMAQDPTGEGESPIFSDDHPDEVSTEEQAEQDSILDEFLDSEE